MCTFHQRLFEDDELLDKAISHRSHIVHQSNQLVCLGSCFCFDQYSEADRRHDKMFSTIVLIWLTVIQRSGEHCRMQSGMPVEYAGHHPAVTEASY